MNAPIDAENAGFKIAIRTEGQFVNAYLWPTAPGSTQQPILMLTIRHSIATKVPGAFDTFVELAKAALEQACVDLFGVRPEMTIERGPESERSGHG